MTLLLLHLLNWRYLYANNKKGNQKRSVFAVNKLSIEITVYDELDLVYYLYMDTYGLFHVCTNGSFAFGMCKPCNEFQNTARAGKQQQKKNGTNPNIQQRNKQHTFLSFFFFILQIGRKNHVVC